MVSIRSSVLGVSFVILTSSMTSLQSTGSRRADRVVVEKLFRLQEGEKPVSDRIGSCFERNETTMNQELTDEYLISRGLSHLGALCGP